MGENLMKDTFSTCSPRRHKAHVTDVLEDVATSCGGDQIQKNMGMDEKLEACTPFPGAPEAGRASEGCLFRCTHPLEQ